MNLSSEGSLHFTERALEANRSSTPRDGSHLQVLALQPGDSGGDLGIRSTKSLRVSLRAQPAVILRRCRVLLPCQQLIQRSLTFRGNGEDKLEALHGAIRRPPQVRSTSQCRLDVPTQRGAPTLARSHEAKQN